jgi:hypothetical protein
MSISKLLNVHYVVLSHVSPPNSKLALISAHKLFTLPPLTYITTGQERIHTFQAVNTISIHNPHKTETVISKIVIFK